MTDSIIQGLVSYFSRCPLLHDGVFYVDGLGQEAIGYMIETGVTAPIVEQYIDGSSIRQYPFNFGSREYYSLDRLQAIQNSTFYERLSNWIEEQSNRGILPDMPEKCHPEKITVQSPGYMFDASMTNARYEIQLMLQYFKEA
jgi:hypothetical protein